jgi:hypothetical protein
MLDNQQKKGSKYSSKEREKATKRGEPLLGSRFCCCLQVKESPTKNPRKGGK